MWESSCGRHTHPDVLGGISVVLLAVVTWGCVLVRQAESCTMDLRNVTWVAVEKGSDDAIKHIDVRLLLLNSSSVQPTLLPKCWRRRV